MAPALWLGRGHPSNRWISVDRYDLMRDCKICVDNLFVFTLARNPNRQNAAIVTYMCHYAHGQERATLEIWSMLVGEDFTAPEQYHQRLQYHLRLLNDCRELLLWFRTTAL